MDAFASMVAWIDAALAIGIGAALVGGLLILVTECRSHQAEPSQADVRRAAERYRRWYGDRALSVIGDHMLAARFAPDSRHSRFLKRVVADLQAGTVIDGTGAGRTDPERVGPAP